MVSLFIVAAFLILIALSKNRPHTFSLKEMLAEFRDHRIDVIRRRTRFLKRKAGEDVATAETAVQVEGVAGASCVSRVE